VDSPDPSDYQPRLRWWSHVWRSTLALAIGGIVWVQVVDAQATDQPLLFWVDLAVGVVAFVLVSWRRRWPMTIAVATVLLTPFTSIGAGAILLATVSLATRRRTVEIIVIGLLNLLSTWGYDEIQPVNDTDPAWLITVFTIVFVAAALAWGMFIGSRRELIWTLHRRAEIAEAERDLRAGQARSTERARIAREMHDVLAHRISQISLQAGALAFRDDLTPADLRSGVTLIQDKAHEALTDLREVLGVLRDDTDSTPLTTPQPTYDDLAALVDEAHAAGAAVELDDHLDEHPPDPVGRTVFRIAQEAITNATKHAPAATIRIEVTGGATDGVHVVVRNALGFGPTRTPGAGLGLIGLSERTELRGGTLTHGIEQQGAGMQPSFVLRAWLPWVADEAPAHERVSNQGGAIS